MQIRLNNEILNLEKSTISKMHFVVFFMLRNKPVIFPCFFLQLWRDGAIDGRLGSFFRGNSDQSKSWIPGGDKQSCPEWEMAQIPHMLLQIRLDTPRMQAIAGHASAYESNVIIRRIKAGL